MKILAKISIVCLFFVGATLATTVFAQGAYEEFKEEIELMREISQIGREIIVERNMQLSTEESQKFWPVYEGYMSAMAEVNDRRVKLITDYADSYVSESLSDKKALRLLSEFLSMERARLKVKRQYVPKFKKVLPPKKVVRFFQVDNKLDSLINIEMAAEIPLVR